MKSVVLFFLMSMGLVLKINASCDYLCMSESKCIPRKFFCDGGGCDCAGCEDEHFCTSHQPSSCPSGWFRCENRIECKPPNFLCDGINDCTDGSDELNCNGGNYLRIPGLLNYREILKKRNLQQKNKSNPLFRWGLDLPRTAVAASLANETFFISSDEQKANEIRYELTIQMFNILRTNTKKNTADFALLVHALFATCVDVTDFFGVNLVDDLRRRVDARNDSVSPFELLVLCNVGGQVTDEDSRNIIQEYNAVRRPFWTDVQAISTLALSCFSTKRGLHEEDNTLKSFLRDLKIRQFRNGTIDNVRTTALVLQSLMVNRTYAEDFDWEGAFKTLVDTNKSESISSLDTYYILPVLYGKSLLNVTNDKCIPKVDNEEEALRKLEHSVSEGKFSVQYSVWIGDQVALGRTWRLKMKEGNTLYDVIETVNKLDKRHKVMYNIISLKPFVSAVSGLEDDPESEKYWFSYVRSMTFNSTLIYTEKSPVDIKLKPDHEFILWYRKTEWIDLRQNVDN